MINGIQKQKTKNSISITNKKCNLNLNFYVNIDTLPIDLFSFFLSERYAAKPSMEPGWDEFVAQNCMMKLYNFANISNIRNKYTVRSYTLRQLIKILGTLTPSNNFHFVKDSFELWNSWIYIITYTVISVLWMLRPLCQKKNKFHKRQKRQSRFQNQKYVAYCIIHINNEWWQ
jgi:hypothetical protein